MRLLLNQYCEDRIAGDDGVIRKRENMQKSSATDKDESTEGKDKEGIEEKTLTLEESLAALKLDDLVYDPRAIYFQPDLWWAFYDDAPGEHDQISVRNRCRECEGAKRASLCWEPRGPFRVDIGFYTNPKIDAIMLFKFSTSPLDSNPRGRC
ncbi:hypothetical protein DSL72_000058 [Monilinia vaccinii-corymbosi]|uniref:Uncharacterized protein n=1 Tax=Monilinia vaccinii-corymbosi TaxID=61207 RepID=A0A8A3P3I7_9HELO|nr:hypothetical protein DSL72_000058 [Monilinia vaccinii-corymbosi]